MRKLLFFTLTVLFYLTAGSQIWAQDSGWVINNFKSEVEVQLNGRVKVVETITVNFNNIQKHGIYRDLVYKKDSTDSKKHFISYDIIEVTLDNASVKYESSYQSDFFRIKIGDPANTISGTHVYSLVYDATGAIGSFANHDELYWNVTGNYWTVPILEAKSTINLPKDGINQITCYTGIAGSAIPCVSNQPNSSSATFTTEKLNPGEGLTAVVGFTKGLVPVLEGKTPPIFGIKIGDILAFSLTFLPIFFIAFYLWYKKGRDHWFKRSFIDDPNTHEEIKPIGSHDTIVVEFDPPEKLRPAEMGTLLSETVHTTSITATIVDLAVRGYLKISEIEKGTILKSKDYELIKQNKEWGELLLYEKELIARIFKDRETVKISSLKITFYKDIKVVKDNLGQGLKDKGLFFGSPDKTRNYYIGIGFILTFFPLFIVSLLRITVTYGPAILIGLALGGITTILFGLFMSARTAKGHELRNRVLGYKLFISTAEKYRQQFFERANMFNEILPYAIVFEQTEKFAKAFAELGVPPPDTNWYVGAAAFNAATFSQDMSSFAGSFSSSMSSSSGFSGGGSGGGGGGGGGGSW